MTVAKYSCSGAHSIHTDIVENIKEEFLPEKVYQSAANFFKIMGDGTRFKILWVLDRQEMCVCDLANVLGMTKSAVSHQLGSLRKANLVQFRKSGKVVYYSIADNHVHMMLKECLDHANHIEV